MIINNVNAKKLLIEFNQSNIYPHPVNFVGGEWDFTFANGTDMGLVNSIIDAHDPTTIPPQLTDKERIEQLERENILLKAQKDVLSEQVDFHEELMVELATKVYE